MSKRRAETYLTKEPMRNRPDEEAESERDKIDPVQIASEEVMAKRKFAKPRRSRFADAGAALDQNNGMSVGMSSLPHPTASGSDTFGSIKAPTFASTLFSFGSSTTSESAASNPFPKITMQTTTPSTTFNVSTSSTQEGSKNIFANIKPSAQPTSMFPPGSPFAKFAPAPTPSNFTPEMATKRPPAAQPLSSRSGGPIRTPRHSVREAAPQTPRQPHAATRLAENAPLLSLIPQTPQPTQSAESISQGALVRSNGDNVPIATPERNPSEPPEKHYWQRIRAMNEAFHEAVGRSIDGDAYCDLEWLFGQYKYWRGEIEKGYPYNPAVDSPHPSKAITADRSKRLEDLKAGITMKPPTPSRSLSHTSEATSFVRSQAPPPETQHIAWDGGSTQSTERAQRFGQTQEIPRPGSKTAETVLGVLNSPPEKDVGTGYISGLESRKKPEDSQKPSSFSFGGNTSFAFNSNGFSATTKGFSFGAKLDVEEKSETTSAPTGAISAIVTPKIESAPTFTFGSSASSSSNIVETSFFGDVKPVSEAKQAPSFGRGSTFPTPSSTKAPSQTSMSASSLSISQPKRTPSPPKRAQQPVKPAQPSEPVVPAANRFAALVAPSEKVKEKEVITIESDDDEKMADETVEEDEEMVEDVEGEDEEFADDDKEGDNISKKDEDEEMEEEPRAEDVAEEVKELVKSSLERKEKEQPKPAPFIFGQSISKTKPFTFGASVGKLTTETETTTPPVFSFGKKDEPEPHLKKAETVDIKPSAPFSIPPPGTSSIQESGSEARATFRFGLPTTPSTFKGPIPDTTPSSALKKEFKFGLPSKSAESIPESLKEPEPDTKETSKSPYHLRSSSPSKRTTEEPPRSPSKRQRSPSPHKKPSEKEELSSALAADTIVVKQPPKPFVFGAKITSKPSVPASFTDNNDEPPDESAEGPKTFTLGSSRPKDYTWTPDKPIKFDTPPSTVNTSNIPTSTFAFGRSTSQPFTFGGISTPAPPPKFGSIGTSPTKFGAFGGTNVSFTSPSLGFSFGQAKSEAKDEIEKKDEPESSQAEAGHAEQEEDEVPKVSEEVGSAGEEDEDTVFSERAKLILRLSAAERQKEIEKAGANPEDVKTDRDYGVGVVRVNVHKETKKARILFRLEGSGRAILNSYLLPGVDYVKQGKSMVLVPAPRNDGQGFESYFVRLKDGSIAETLAKTLQDRKNSM